MCCPPVAETNAFPDGFRRTPPNESPIEIPYRPCLGSFLIPHSNRNVPVPPGSRSPVLRACDQLTPRFGRTCWRLATVFSEKKTRPIDFRYDLLSFKSRNGGHKRVGCRLDAVDTLMESMIALPHHIKYVVKLPLIKTVSRLWKLFVMV